MSKGIIRSIIDNDLYYSLMSNMSADSSFEKLHSDWYNCFAHILLAFNVGHNEDTIKSLFYDFDMDNWKSMHKENTEYSDSSKEELIKDFCGECSYICDRTSYDRLFRTHWLFRQSFRDELLKAQYPSIG